MKSLWLSLTVQGPRAQGLGAGQERGVWEVFLACGHCRCLGAFGEAGRHSLQGCGGRPLRVTAGEGLTAWVWGGV